MLELRSLDSSFLPHFQEMLERGFTLGPRVANLIDLSNGSLNVWMPKEITTISPKDLSTDINYPKPWESKTEICKYLVSVLPKDSSTLLLGETHRFVNEKPPLQEAMHFAWLIVSSSIPAYDRFLCVCSINLVIDHQTWSDFRREIKLYPSIVVIAKQPADLALTRGEFNELEENRLTALLEGTQYVLVGVFDEMSMIVWARNSKQSDAYLEVY